MVTESRPPTIHTVAERAGVSKSLVSLVLRGSPNVSEQRRRDVLCAIDELGYRPNAVARSLVTQRTSVVGVLVSDLQNPFFADVVSGLQERARQSSYRVIVGTGDRDAAAERDILDAFLELRVEGLILLSPRVSRQQIAGYGPSVPVVVVGRGDVRVRGVDTVNNDDEMGARLVVDHLADLGHRSIAHLAGGEGAGSAERRAGYEQRMRHWHLDDHIRVVTGDFTDEGGYDAARRLLDGGDLPTAVFAANDVMAVGAMTALEEAGLSVPGDVSIVGHDNTSIAKLRHVGLTSVNQPRLEMGRLAMDALMERVSRGRTRAKHQVLQPELIVRTTSAAP